MSTENTRNQQRPNFSNHPGPSIRLLVVDDHEVVRKGLVMLLSLEPDMEVCGDAGDGLTAIKLATTLLPDVILMDLKMPGMGGAEATQIIKATLPQCKVLILTGVDIDALAFDALQSGVDGYILKEVRSAELLRAVRTVASGGAYLDQTITRKVLNRLSHPSPPASDINLPLPRSLPATTNYQAEALKGEIIESLSERECEVLQAVALGNSNREISEALTVTEGTIRTHLKNIFRKLNVNDRTQAVVTGLRLGLIKLWD